MYFEIELFFPIVVPGSGAKTSSIGLCRVITQPVFVTMSDHAGGASAIALAELREVDRIRNIFTTVLGRVGHPRHITFPDRIYVETGTGHSMAINGDLIARILRHRRRSDPTPKVVW